MDNQTPGGFWIRFAAICIDLLIFLGFILVPGMFIILSGDADFVAYAGIILYILVWLASLFYFAMMPASNYQGTIGKRVLGLKIVDKDGNKISMGKSWLRYLGYIVSGIFYIGYIIVAFTPKKQGLHDMMAGTYVVKIPPEQTYSKANSQKIIV